MISEVLPYGEIYGEGLPEGCGRRECEDWRIQARTSTLLLEDAHEPPDDTDRATAPLDARFEDMTVAEALARNQAAEIAAAEEWLYLVEAARDEACG